ncbi:GTP-binding protein [Candidatus Woesearchaeota archaeon]|nr:GTP-binding protein [Candidatus Woesearchaeota archaeon]
MNFQSISPIENYQFYLDLAFRRAREKGKQLRSKKLKGGSLEKSKHIELMKMQVIADTISSRMQKIIFSFPNLDELDEFYRRLLKLSLDYRQLKKSLGAVDWLRKRAFNMLKIYRSKLDKNRQFSRINAIKREFLGRISSMVRQVKDELDFLENARKIMKGFPTIKTSLKTAAIAGFPNVGKTTLLYKLSGSKADIKSYPFTTKGINVAYIGTGKQRIQLLDTPGTLDRFEKMNNIEKTAYLAIKYCADIIVYVFDLTEEYPIGKQAKLYEKLKRDFDEDILVYFSKSDIIGDFGDFKKKYRGYDNSYKLRQELLDRL